MSKSGRSFGTGMRRLLAPVARIVVGTRFEDPAYAVWNVLTRRHAVASNREYDRQIVRVMRRVLEPSSNGIDVGAHRGTILRHLVELAPQGHHVAVEPLPAFAAGLRRRFSDVEVLEVALSDAHGKASFHHVVTNPSYSGLSTRRYPSHEVVQDIKVCVAPLDDLVDPDRPVRFVKVDVEGGELGTLKGARRLLERWRPVVAFEHGWDRGRRPADDTTAALWEVLTDAGLDVYEIPDWLDHGAPLTEEAFEAALSRGSYYFLAAAGL